MISAGLATVAEIHLPICSPPASEFASGMGFSECKQDLRKKTPEEKTLSVTSHLGPWSTRMLYKASGLRLEKPDLKDHIVLESISLCNYSVKNAYVSKIHYIFIIIYFFKMYLYLSIYIYLGNWWKCVFSMFKNCWDFFVSAPAKPQAPLEVVLES